MCAMVDRYHHQQGPITSGYVSNSDIQQKERQEQIKWQQQKEYEDMMNKHYPNSKQGEVTGLSLPLKDHEGFRRSLQDQRHKEYNMFVSEKQDVENKRKEDLYWNAQNYRPSQPPVTTYDHKQIAKEKAEEKQNDYKEYLDNPTKSYRQQEERKKLLSRERNNEYNEFLEQKKEKENAKRLRPPPTPPGGLNIIPEQERKQQAQAKKAAYRDDLLKLEQEQMYQRAKQNGDVRVMSYNQSPPPQSPPRGRPPAHPDSARRRGPPPSDRMEPMDRRPLDELKTGFFDDRRIDPPNRDHRKEDYQKHLAELQRQENMKHQKLEEMRHAPHAEVKRGDYYNADTYEQKRQSLNSEKREEYQNRLSKKTPEPEKRREWNDKSDPKGILAGIDSYNYEQRKTFAEERKQEYKDIMEKQGVPTSVEHNTDEEPELIKLALGRKQDTADPINLNDVKIFPVGEGYAAKQRELQAERRTNFKAFAKKKSEVYKREKDNRDSFRAMLDRELMESPPILPIGEYDTKKRHFRQEAHKEMINHLERQPHSNREKDFWNKSSQPRIFPQSGEYKNRKQKLNDELRKEWRDYIIKQEPSKERNKDFGTPGAVLFTGEYEKTKKKIREERTKDMLIQLEKQGNKPPRRSPEMANTGTIGFMASLGQHEKERERLNFQKRDAYNKYLDEKNYSRDGFPKDSHYWANGKEPPESWFKADNRPFNSSPSRDQLRSRHSHERDNLQRDQPRSFDRRPSPSYQDILDSKRQQEKLYRRDDPEYSRPGGQQYGPGPDNSRSGGQQYGPGPDYSRSGGQQYGPGPDYLRSPHGQSDGYGGRYE